MRIEYPHCPYSQPQLLLLLLQADPDPLLPLQLHPPLLAMFLAPSLPLPLSLPLSLLPSLPWALSLFLPFLLTSLLLLFLISVIWKKGSSETMRCIVLAPHKLGQPSRSFTTSTLVTTTWIGAPQMQMLPPHLFMPPILPLSVSMIPWGMSIHAPHPSSPITPLQIPWLCLTPNQPPPDHWPPSQAQMVWTWTLPWKGSLQAWN